MTMTNVCESIDTDTDAVTEVDPSSVRDGHGEPVADGDCDRRNDAAGGDVDGGADGDARTNVDADTVGGADGDLGSQGRGWADE